MRAQLHDLYEYNQYYNQQYLDVLHNQPCPEQCLELLSHILNAHHIWLRRIQGQKVDLTLWQVHTLAIQKELNESLHQETFRILTETPEELSKKYVFYQNNDGQSFVNKLSEILFHLINHGTHHRAQIALLLRQNGISPPGSDYIFYKRDEHLRRK